MKCIIITTGLFWPNTSIFKFEGLRINVVKLPKLPEFLVGILIQVIEAKQDFIHIIEDGALQCVFEGKLQAMCNTLDIYHPRLTKALSAANPTNLL